MNPTPHEQTRIAITRRFSATPKLVWDCWTNPAHILRWFGSDPNGHGVSAQADLQPGANFEITFSNADGTQHTCTGTYADVRPHTNLSFTWRWKGTEEPESFVTIALTPHEAATEMRFEHTNLGHASSHDYAAGWQRTFDKLDRLLQTPSHLDMSS